MGTKLRACMQPGEEVVHMDIVIGHSTSFHRGPPAGQQRPERRQGGSASLRWSPWMPALCLRRSMHLAHMASAPEGGVAAPHGTQGHTHQRRQRGLQSTYHPSTMHRRVGVHAWY